MENDDPRPGQFLGKACSFDHQGRRLVGTVESQRFIGRTQRGAIPDWELTIRGKSGNTLKISLVESFTSFTDTL